MNKVEMLKAIADHAKQLGITTDVVSMNEFCDPKESNNYTQICHVRGRSPIGNVISMGVAWVQYNTANYEKSTITADEIATIDAGGLRGMIWV